MYLYRQPMPMLPQVPVVSCLPSEKDRIERVRQYQAAYRAAHREKARAYARDYNRKNATRIAARDKVRRQRNAPRRREMLKRWIENNKARVREYRLQYYRRRRSSDPMFRIRMALTSRILSAIRRNAGVKSKKTIRLLGCDIAFFRDYLESRFTQGMTWDNYGRGPDRWQIDHRIPCAAFDLLEPRQQAQCFHYSNLQPLWGRDNRSKWDKTPEPHQSELL